MVLTPKSQHHSSSFKQEPYNQIFLRTTFLTTGLLIS